MNTVPSQLKDAFAELLDIDSADQRNARLDEICGNDLDLRAEVESLLAAHHHAADFLSRADGDRPGFPHDQAVSETPGTHVGPYKLLEQIGQGAFGTVFMAEQTVPVRRTVAVKILKPGMDSKEVIARFEAERQALAMMDHPHIARVLDAGTTDSGRPFFVMELVRGIPITDYCDEVRLSNDERLRLFIDVCRAVQHAHLKGIIHRDLKPSNVMITMHDDRPVVKVIDFGIAKALTQPLTDRTLFTGYHQLLGTPLYMSPEQAQLSGLDVDTRSDVYSLGVLLYELLTGTTPFDRETLRNAGFDQLRQIIAEREPPRPSARLTTLNEAHRSTLAARRQVDQRKISDQLRGELDWIVMKALEKDRTRRYESASAFAADIQRYLDNEPVAACPPSIGYRLKKYAHRHQGLLVTVGLVLFTAVFGTIVSLRFAHSAREHATEALLARAKAEQHALDLKEATSWSQTLLYVAEMKLASDALANEDTPRAAELLRRHIPQPGTPDPRGFEWYYFDKRVSAPQSVAIELGGWVDDVEISPDGAWLAAAAPNGELRIYDTSNWKKPYRTFQTAAKSVHGIAWSPDGARLAAACDDGHVFVWSFESGDLEFKIAAHTGAANDIAFSPDGQSFYSCGDDNVARKWAAESGELLLVFSGHEREVEQLAVSRMGRLLVTASSDDSFATWDTVTGQIENRHGNFDGHGSSSRVVCVACSDDGQFVAAGNIDGQICLAESRSGVSKPLVRSLDGVEALTFLDGSRWLAAADRGGSVQLYDVHELQKHPQQSESASSLRWMAHEGRALALAATPDGKSLLSGGRDGIVRLWTPDLRPWPWKTFRDDDTRDVAVGPDDRMYVAGRGIGVWDLSSRRLVDTFALADSLWFRIACSADGRFLAAARPGSLALFELPSQRLVNEWPIDDAHDPSTLAISPDGRYVACADSTEREFVEVYDRDNHLPIKRLPARQCECLTFSPDGRWFAASHQDDLRVFDFDSESDRPCQTLRGHSSTLSDAAFSPDGRLLATVSDDRLLKIREWPSGELRESIVAHRDEVNSVAFAPDGRTIATGADDGRVRLWHTATGQPLGEFPRERREVSKVVFDHTGRRIIARVDDTCTTVHDAAPMDGRLSATSSERNVEPAEFVGLGTPPGVDCEIRADRLSPDGRYVLLTPFPTKRGIYRWSKQGGFEAFSWKNHYFHMQSVANNGMVCGSAKTARTSWRALMTSDAGPWKEIAPATSFAEDVTPDGKTFVGTYLKPKRQGGQAFRCKCGCLHIGNAAHVVAVRYHAANWQYNNNTVWLDFTPSETDRLLAEVDFTENTVTPLEGESGTFEGIALGYASGDLSFTAERFDGKWNPGEFEVRGTRFTTEGPSSAEVALGDPGKGVSVGDGAVGTGYLMYSTEVVRKRFGGNDPIEYLPQSERHAYAAAVRVTADGERAFGYVYNMAGDTKAGDYTDSHTIHDSEIAVWTDEGLQILPGFDPAYNWRLRDISADGSVIVGFRWPPGQHWVNPIDQTSATAFRWEAGEVTLLGSLPTYQHSIATCVSADGRFVGGHCLRAKEQGLHDTAFLWDAERGLQSLTDVLARTGSRLDGWELKETADVSDDGLTLVGAGVNPEGRREGWLAHLPAATFGPSQEKTSGNQQVATNNGPRTTDNGPRTTDN